MTRQLSRRRRRQLADVGKAAGARVAVVLHRVFGDRSDGRIGILMYHRIVPFVPDDDPPDDTVSPTRFRAQLEGLLERGFRFAPLVEALECAARREPLPPRTAVVTFDDGFSNVYEYAFPVLADLNVPATVFVVTAHIGTEEPFPFDRWGVRRRASAPAITWRPLDWTACEHMQESGLVQIGSHTHTHGDFRGRADDFERDVRTSLDVLTARLGPGPRPFAFPYGSVRRGFAGPLLANAARRAGVTSGLTTQTDLVELRTDPFSWGRLDVVGSDSAQTCAAKLAGCYNWMDSTRSVFQRIATR